MPIWVEEKCILKLALLYLSILTYFIFLLTTPSIVNNIHHKSESHSDIDQAAAALQLGKKMGYSNAFGNPLFSKSDDLIEEFPTHEYLTMRIIYKSWKL